MMIRYLYSQLASYLYLIILLFLVEGIGRVAILFKARPHLPKRNLFCFSDTRAHLHFNTSVSKMMKNAFHFIFETSLFSRYFDFFLDFWGTCRKSRLIIRKISLISKFMMPHRSTACWSKRITIQILFNIYLN